MKTRTLSVVIAAGAASTASADFASDFGVAWDGQGQLQVEFNFDSVAVISSFVNNGGANGNFNGFFSDEPGFANFEEDEADEGLFVVPDGTVVGFELISSDAAFVVYDPFFDAALAPSDTYEIGSVSRDGSGNVTSGFDDHPFWTVDVDAPGFDENILTYEVTFRLFDARTDGNALAPTDPITVEFTRIPAPGTAALLGLAGLGAARRRR